MSHEEKTLPALTVSKLQAKYRAGETTPEQMIREIVRRAGEDEEYRIWITPPSMERIQPYLDRLAGLDPAQAPLWGIPFAVKDNIDVAGLPTTAGCKTYAYTPSDHATAVQRLVDAGAIPVGKTNLDQFATGLVGTRSPYGETRNALRPELISGGSSSGSAVAVARGHAAFALGTDTAGSGRVPAALNRIVGYKPSLGAWPTRGVVPACASLDCVTVFAHSLDDALAVDRAVRGPDDADPWSRRLSVPTPELPWRLCLPHERPGFYGPFAAQYERAWDAAVARLAGLGMPIAYIDMEPFAEAAALLYEGPWVAERWAVLGGFIEAYPGAAFPVTERILRSGAEDRYDAASVYRAMHRLQALKMETRKWLEGAVLAMPTCGGTWTREQVRLDPIGANREMGRYTNHCNLLDLCAAALPADDAEANTPFGITLFALAENESLLCGAAEAFISGSRRLSAAEAAELRGLSAPPAFPGNAALSDASALIGSTSASILEAASETSALSGNAAFNALPGAFDSSIQPATASDATPAGGSTLIAVCGLHMRGYPLESQMLASGAQFVNETRTAAKYRMVKLPTFPAKPGLIKVPTKGVSVLLELWEMPLPAFGAFAAAIPAPLGIGKVELEDGREVPGFVCEAYAAESAEDISAAGGWRRASFS